MSLLKQILDNIRILKEIIYNVLFIYIVNNYLLCINIKKSYYNNKKLY